MKDGMRRRNLLILTGAGFSGILAGCLSTERLAGNDDTETVSEQTDTSAEATSFEDREGPPEYDCDTAERPEPDALDTSDEDAVEPVSYPAPLDSTANQDTVVTYIKEYEQAYRRNESVSRWEAQLDQFSMGFSDTRVYDSPVNAALVRVQYQYGETIEQSGEVVYADSPIIFVTYYVDQSVVIRAESGRTPEDPDTLYPDPWLEGNPVQCF
ncbi:hypothetical protein HUG10_10980 [Halorarum halophilum]|uniref:Uncharacterized protein n=1 Tax=Halorarum halophilum TaxID=2743090 RepID=A0A7D5GC65_9EURY|nr:hypothetical protein [Halobaculum halophilum]QLG28046.1 hypothetical protein HUG10_10980 [Halobaculum halophilum]